MAAGSFLLLVVIAVTVYVRISGERNVQTGQPAAPAHRAQETSARGSGERGWQSGGAIAVLNTSDFHALTFGTSDPNLVYFGHHSGVMRSTDGGRTWSVLMNRPNFDGMGMAVSKSDPRRIYLAGHNIFQTSADGGATWQPVANNLPGQDIHGFAMSQENSDRLFSLVVGAGLFRSEDAGRTWQRLAGEVPPDVMALAVGGSPETIYAGSMRFGVLRSNDGGQSWTSATNGLGSRAVLSLAVDPTAPQTVYAGVENGLYKSDDGGASWSKLAFPGANAHAVSASPSRPGTVLALAVQDKKGLVYRSEDGGATWGAGS